MQNLTPQLVNAGTIKMTYPENKVLIWMVASKQCLKIMGWKMEMGCNLQRYIFLFQAADENFENLRKQYATGVQRIRDESDESIDIRTFLRLANIKWKLNCQNENFAGKRRSTSGEALPPARRELVADNLRC